MSVRKAQAWGFDMLMAVSLFVMTMLMFYLYSLNLGSETEDTLKAMSYDGNVAADRLLSEGYPTSWTTSNVVTPGILSNNKINQTKFEQFYTISQSDYNKAKQLLQTKYDFYIFFSEPMQVTGDTIYGIGRNYTSASNVVKVSRITIYENKPTTLTIYIWN